MATVPTQVIHELQQEEHGINSIIPESASGITELVPSQEQKQSIASSQETQPFLTQLVVTGISPSESVGIPSKVTSIGTYTPESLKDNPAVTEKELIRQVIADDAPEQVANSAGNQLETANESK